MNHVTISLRSVRLTVSTAVLSDLLLFIAVYLSFIALWRFAGRESSLHYLQYHYWHFTTILSSLLSLPDVVTIGLVVVGRWVGIALLLLIVARLFGHRVSTRHLLRLVMASEFIFLLPAWSHRIWVEGFQGNLNTLPADSFEPLRCFPEAWGPSWSTLDSYWWMHAMLVSVGVAKAAQKHAKWLFVSLMIALAGAAVGAQMTWLIGVL